jgi:hypothetical protein
MTSASRQADESAVADAQWRAFCRAYDGRHNNYVAEASKFNDFYCGKQWDEALEAALKAEGKPVLTINIAKKTINTILGTYSNSRADIVFKPKKNAVEEQARVMTLLVDHILNTNKYHHLERTVALSGWITDRGYLDVRMDFDDNVLGEVRISDLDSRDVVLDPDAKRYDPRTWSEVSVINWMSLDTIAETYGQDKADKISSYIGTHGGTGTYGSESVRFGIEPGQRSTTIYVPGASREDERRIRSIRVIERQWRKMGRVTEFVDLESGDLREVPEGWTKERIREVAEKYGLVVRKRMKSRIRWTVTADRVVLHDEWSPYDRFTVVPYFPYFVAGNPTGVMRDLISPQEQLNKTESQELHIINTTANSGWMIQAGSLVNMTNDELEERGAQTGLVIVYGTNKEKPEKIQPNTIPTGIDRVGQKAFQYITEIPGTAPLTSPQLKSEVSGVAYERASSNAMSTLKVVFDNLDFTRELLADIIVCMVQKFYTEERIFKITDWRHPEQPEIDVEINTDLLNNVMLGEYDIIATSAPAQDTAEDREFAQIIEMRSAGVETIPDYHVVLASNLKNKQVIAQESKKIQGLAEPTEEEMAKAAQMEELQLRALMAEVAKLEAEVAELGSRAELAMAKAEVTVAAENREMTVAQHDAAFELHKLKADMAKTAANLMNKLELAGIHVQAKEGVTRYSTQMKAGEKELDRQNAVTLAKLKPKPKPAAKKPARKGA